jgi:hypothetical protein
MTANAPLLASLVLACACGTINARSDDDGAGADGGADPCPETGCACDDDGACSPHQVCVGEGERTCECAAGYDGAPCAWVGVVTDPGFVDDAAWEGLGGARVLTSEPGEIDLGVGYFDGQSSCALGALQQSVTMPPWERAEPLVAQITYASFSDDGIAVGLGSTWAILPSQFHGDPEQPEWNTARLCLGSAAYGGEQRLTIAPGERPTSCGGGQNFAGALIDRFEIVPAEEGECAPPGEVANGDAEAEGGWTFATGGTATADLVDGAGAMGSRAARLELQSTCDYGSVSVALSVPSVPTALELWVKTSPGSPFQIGIDGMQHLVASERGEGIEERIRLCLPAHFQGRGTRLSAVVFDESDGFCSEPLGSPVHLSIDDVRLIEDPSCADDAGFESMSRQFGQHAWRTGDRAEVIEYGEAHGGSRVFWIRAANRGNDPGLSQPILVPNGPHPSLRVWLASSAPTDVTDLYMSLGGQLTIVPEGTAWREQIFCIDPVYAGRPSVFYLFLNAGPGPTGPLGSAHDWWLDDLRLSAADPACPMP